jgi:hypothetical protein
MFDIEGHDMTAFVLTVNNDLAKVTIDATLQFRCKARRLFRRSHVGEDSPVKKCHQRVLCSFCAVE